MTGFPLKITAIYALFSVLWLTGSDQLVVMLYSGSAAAMQTSMGWIFIIITSLLLFILLDRERKHRSRTEADLEQQQAALHRLDQAVSQSPVTILVADLDGRINYVNAAFENMSGYSREEAIGKTPAIFQSGKTPQSTYDELWETLRKGQLWEGELLNQRKDGQGYWVHARISPVRNRAGEIDHFLAIEEDITLRKAQENQIIHQANYDSLTELPNRFLAMDRMSQSINTAIRNDQTVVLMFIDLDDFKRINDTLGHDIGDQLITLAASRVRDTVRQTDTVARYGGDEFLVILTDLDEPDDATRVAEKVLTVLANPFHIEGRELSITASIGMSVFPEDGQDPYELLRNADAAMFGAKDEGGNCCEFYSAAINEAAMERMQVEQKLRHALENRELSLNYHPLVNMAGDHIAGAEALLRWDNPELGQIPPDRFIPLAEATGLIIPIGEWVIRTACAQLQAWKELGLSENFRLSINVSPRQLRDVRLLQVIEQALHDHELRGDQLELEVTEGLLLRNQAETRKTLTKLRAMGIHIALDDFGTGYSSLNHLKSFPFDTLKIDRSFIENAEKHPQDRALVNATVTMAVGLGLKTVGEGVETAGQLECLRIQGIHSVQGFFFTPPLPADQFERFYLEFNARASNG